jgi:hypothetical protein
MSKVYKLKVMEFFNLSQKKKKKTVRFSEIKTKKLIYRSSTLIYST